jgi:hypothetical protein
MIIPEKSLRFRDPPFSESPLDGIQKSLIAIIPYSEYTVWGNVVLLGIPQTKSPKI